VYLEGAGIGPKDLGFVELQDKVYPLVDKGIDLLAVSQKLQVRAEVVAVLDAENPLITFYDGPPELLVPAVGRIPAAGALKDQVAVPGKDLPQLRYPVVIVVVVWPGVVVVVVVPTLSVIICTPSTLNSL